MSTSQVLEFDRNLCKQGNIYGCMAFYYIINKQNPTMPNSELVQWVLNYRQGKTSTYTPTYAPMPSNEPFTGSGVEYRVVNTKKGKALAVVIGGSIVALLPLAL